MKRAALLLLLVGCAGRGRLSAGSVNDNDRYRDYVRYFKAYPDHNVRKIDVTDRMVLSFRDLDGRPISNARVRIRAEGETVYRAVTTAGGELMFPPRAVGVDEGVRSFEAEIDGRRERFGRGERQDIRLDVPRPWRDEVDLDVAFCLDTTGSMGDEIRAIKRTLRDVVARIGRLRPRPRLRFGMVTYRDRGDEYVTRLIPFTRDLDAFHDRLSRVRAAGGGDYEESVSEALHRSVYDLDWNRGAAIRLLFLIGDAPPHTDRVRAVDYTLAMRRALEEGIKIPTIAASGLNDKGEFIWRQLAQFTLAPFTFISYGGRTPHHVGSYRENNLDDLMVKVVEAELESMSVGGRQDRPVTRGQGRAPTDFCEYRGD